jgi:hypothetical protein
MHRIHPGLAACTLVFLSLVITAPVRAAVGTEFTYQGQLIESGIPANGNYDFRLFLFNADAGGSQIGVEAPFSDVTVTDGLFQLNVDFGPGTFTGNPRWIEILVRPAGSGTYTTLSPRQEVNPAPYAMHSRSSEFGQTWVGNATAGLDIVNQRVDANAFALRGDIATGTALRGLTTGGLGVFGYSGSNHGVQGASQDGSGGHFSSDQGYGIRVTTTGSDHWDHGAFIDAAAGYGVYAKSSNNMAIRGEAGDITGLWQPIGAVGAVGIGASRGLYGSGGSSYGIYGTSLNWYGTYSRTSRSDNNYGFYSPDNLYTSNINMAGATMQVVQNGGSETLESGEIAVFSGISQVQSRSGGGETAIVQVARSDRADSEAVAGVVFSRFNGALLDHDGTDLPPDTEVTPAGPIAPGDYMLLVVRGPTEVKVNDASRSVLPGSLLATSDEPGLATGAGQLSSRGAAAPGTILGKTLGPGRSGSDRVYVYVTLQ